MKPVPEQAGLPAWLYPVGFWAAVVLLALGLFFPDLAVWGVAWVGLVPVLAAVWVVCANLKKDRRLSVAAALALAGLGLVVLVRGWV